MIKSLNYSQSIRETPNIDYSQILRTRRSPKKLSTFVLRNDHNNSSVFVVSFTCRVSAPLFILETLVVIYNYTFHMLLPCWTSRSRSQLKITILNFLKVTTLLSSLLLQDRLNQCHLSFIWVLFLTLFHPIWTATSSYLFPKVYPLTCRMYLL